MRVVFLVLALLCLAPATAVAQVPPGPTDTAPDFIRVVGHDGSGAPDPAGRFQVVIRDLGNNPVPGATVGIDCSACTDLALGLDPTDPGKSLDCDTRTVTGTTDANGNVWFTIVGHGLNPGAAPGPGARCVNIWKQLPGFERTLVKYATANLLDQQGADGMGISDLSAFLLDLGSGTYFGRSDYSQNLSVDIVDLAVWLQLFGAGGSAVGFADHCP